VAFCGGSRATGASGGSVLPVLLAAGELPEIATPAAWILDRFGYRYLLLRRVAERPGCLDEVTEEPNTVQPQPRELAGSEVSWGDIAPPEARRRSIGYRSRP
jgi:hypothetical protein